MLKNKIHTEYSLLRQLPQAIAIIGLKNEIVFANNKWLADFSTITAPSITGQRIDLSFEEMHPNWIKTLQQCLQGEPGVSRTNHYIDANGVEKWFEISKTAWHDDEENVIGWVVQAEKASQRVANELLVDKLRLLSTELSDISKMGIWEYNLEQDKLFWCDMTKIIHGVPIEYNPTLDKATAFFKSGYSRNTFAMTIERALMNRSPWREKLQLITANGTETQVIVSGNPLYYNNEFSGLIGTIQNIDSLVVSETKTRENEYHLRTLVDNLPLNVFIKDLDSRKVLVNKAEMAYCGVTNEAEIIGKDDFFCLDQETAKKSRKDDLKVMAELKPILGKEMEHVKTDGTKTVFLTSKIPLVQKDGKAYGLVGISMDITELKKKEEKLRSLNKVTSLQNKKLLNFAHIVSHNLRSHTANFSMLLDFLNHETQETERAKLMAMLNNASDSLLETIANLNEVVEITGGKDLEKKEVNLNQSIKYVEQNLAALIVEENVSIINTVGNDVSIKVVPAYMESILLNFITNAIKYRSPERKPIIRLASNAEAGYTVLKITDNGLGIDLEKHGDKLFGMYKTFHNNPDAKGIGLYITKNQIEAMNGKVTVTSTVGQGTTFKIFFNEQDQ